MPEKWSKEYIIWTEEVFDIEEDDSLVLLDKFEEHFGPWIRTQGTAYYKYLYWRLFI